MVHFSDPNKLVEKLDLTKISALAPEADPGKLIGLLTQTEPQDLAHLATVMKERNNKVPLPEGERPDRRPRRHRV